MEATIVTKFIRRVKADRKITKALDEDIKKIAVEAETDIKKKTPVDTGRLKASITARKTDFLKAEVFTNVSYASPVEFGTTRMSPRAMFRKGIAEIEKKGTKLLKRVNL